MAKLTAAQIRALETVEYHLKRAADYLAKDSVVLAVKKPTQTTTLDYVDGSGNVLFSVDKEIGSDIAGLSMAREYLRNFINFNAK